MMQCSRACQMFIYINLIYETKMKKLILFTNIILVLNGCMSKRDIVSCSCTAHELS